MSKLNIAQVDVDAEAGEGLVVGEVVGLGFEPERGCPSLRRMIFVLKWFT